MTRIPVLSSASYDRFDQLVEVATLIVFELEVNVPRLITNLLTSEALTDVFANITANSWPGAAFLYSRHHFADPLMTHRNVCTKENLVLIQLRHYNHTDRSCNRCCDGGYFEQRTPFEFGIIESFFCLK